MADNVGCYSGGFRQTTSGILGILGEERSILSHLTVFTEVSGTESNGVFCHRMADVDLLQSYRMKPNKIGPLPYHMRWARQCRPMRIVRSFAC